MVLPRCSLAVAAVTCGAALGCGGAPIAARPSPDSGLAEPTTTEPAEPPPSLSEDLPRLAAGVAAMWEALAQRLHAAGRDCPAATVAVTGVRAEFAAVIAAQASVVASERTGDHDRARAFDRALDDVGERLSAAVARLLAAPALEACAGSIEFTTAFDRWPDASPR